MSARLVALALAVAGCGGSGSTVLVELGSGTRIDGIANLALDVAAGGSERHYALASPRSSIPPAISIAIEVPPSITGPLHGDVRALDAAGNLLARGVGDVILAPGRVARLPIALGEMGSTAAR